MSKKKSAATEHVTTAHKTLAKLKKRLIELEPENQDHIQSLFDQLPKLIHNTHFASLLTQLNDHFDSTQLDASKEALLETYSQTESHNRLYALAAQLAVSHNREQVLIEDYDTALKLINEQLPFQCRRLDTLAKLLTGKFRSLCCLCTLPRHVTHM